MGLTVCSVEHIVDGQYVRHYVGGSADQMTPQKLAIKQYTLENYEPRQGDATIIVMHAHGFAKETYEPLFDTLFLRAQFGIRGIWIADIADMGRSAVLNERNLGNHPHYFDHSRDLLHLINVFREQMPMPLIGIAHSMATSQLAFLSHMHPRLFASLIMIESIMTPDVVIESHAIRKFAVLMPDYWPSREEAEMTIKQRPAYKTLDPRVIQKMTEVNFRDTPTLLYPDRKGVTLTTSKHQLAFWSARPWQKGDVDELPEQSPTRQKPMDDIVADTSWRQELRDGFRLLKYLHPPVAFISGTASQLLSAKTLQRQVELTGTAIGGNGGTSLGNVDNLLVEGGHLLPFERVEETADAMVQSMHRHLEKWKSTVGISLESWSKKSLLEKQTMTDDWPRHVRTIDDEIKRRRSKL